MRRGLYQNAIIDPSKNPRTQKILVGAGLLAKAVYQSTSMLNVSQLSRASPLPQGLR